MSWNDKTTVKKGDIGEAEVVKYLSAQGYSVYKDVTNKAHPFDIFAVSLDCSHKFIADVKTKPSRMLYPDTGIDIKHYNKYLDMQKTSGLQFFLYFVDENNYLSELTKDIVVKLSSGKKVNYPLKQKEIIYFPIVLTRPLFTLSPEVVDSIKQFSTRNYNYT